MVSVQVVTVMNRLFELSLRLEPAITQLVYVAAERVAQIAATLAPVDTGRLRDSFVAELTGSLTAEAITDVPYAIYQEFGTRFMAAHPFFAPAADQVSAIINELFESIGGLGI